MKAGTIIVCPECSRPQLRSTKDLAPGDQIKNAEFESLGFDMEHAIRMSCGDCGALWSRKHPISGATQIHTEKDGWIPLSKTNEKPEPKKLFIPETH